MGRASLLLVLLLAGCTPRVVAEPPAETLLPQQPQSRELRPGETHRYALTIATDQYVWIDATQQGIDLRLTLHGPEGEKLESVDDQTPGGLENLYWITDRGGLYSLEAEAIGAGKTAGRYQLDWKWYQPATEELRLRTPSDRAYTRAFGLQNKSGRERWAAAIALYEPTLAIWQKVGDRAQEASTLDNLGTCHQQLEEFSAAAGYFRRAVAVWPEPDFSPSKANSLHNLAGAQIALEQPLEAVRSYQAALEILERQLLEIPTARALHGLGGAYLALGELAEAQSALEKALAIAERSGDARLRALILNTQGSVYTLQGHLDIGLGTLKEAQTLADGIAADRDRVIAAVVSNQAAIYDWIGEPMLALSSYRRALEINLRLEDRSGEAAVQRLLGFLYRGLGDYDEAVARFKQSADLKEILGKQLEAAETRVLLGDVHRLAGRPGVALEVITRSLSDLEPAAAPEMRATAFEKQGLALEALGRRAEARSSYERALELLEGNEEPWREAGLRATLGENLLETSSGDEPRAYVQRALELSRRCGDRATEIRTLVILANLDRRRGSLVVAQARVDEALALIEGVRSHVGGEHFRVSFLAQQLDAFALAGEILLERHRREPTGGFDRTAFELSERMRARMLYDLVASSRADLRTGVDKALLERERDLRHQLNARQHFLATIGSKLAAERRSELERGLTNLLHALREVEGLIYRQSPRFESLRRGEPLSFQAVQSQVLDANTALLELLLGEDHSQLWVITRERHRLVELPSRRELEALAGHLLEQLTFPARRPAQQTLAERRAWPERSVESAREYVRLGARLSALLLGQVGDLVERKRLVVVADGALQRLPFGALPTPESKPESWRPWLAEHEVVQAPSAAVLLALRAEHQERRPPDRLLAIFADPVFQPEDSRVNPYALTKTSPPDAEPEIDGATLRGRLGVLSRLRHTRDEADALTALVDDSGSLLRALDFDASRSAALGSSLGRYRFLHFATHGIVDDRQPELSGIALSMVDPSGGLQNGFVLLNDIYELKLNADLVVLSACDTAVGRVQRGEGLLSLARGFMYAGARRALASYWPVNDKSTSELMGRFYRRLLQSGQTSSEAFRGAVVETCCVPGGQRPHPYYWAGFGLFGDWR